MRLFLLSLTVVTLVGCAPGAPRLYRGAMNEELMIVVEPKGRSEMISHVIFAKPQRRSSGDYARLDIRKGVDCKAGELSMKDVSAYSPSGALINTVSKPAGWTPAEGSETIALRIVCDRKFAAARTLNGRLDQIAAFYRTEVAKAS